MLNIGSFISLSKGVKHYLVCAFEKDYSHLLECTMNFALKKPKVTIYCLINLSGNNNIDDLNDFNKIKPHNLKIIFYPSNRIIEKHILVLQFITKNPKIKHLGILDNGSQLNFECIKLIKGISIIKVDGKKTIILNTNIFNKHTIKNQQINQFKALYSKTQ